MVMTMNHSWIILPDILRVGRRTDVTSPTTAAAKITTIHIHQVFAVGQALCIYVRSHEVSPNVNAEQMNSKGMGRLHNLAEDM